VRQQRLDVARQRQLDRQVIELAHHPRHLVPVQALARDDEAAQRQRGECLRAM